jgi:Rab3 GTPase-activating protein catalytic subunit
LDEGLDFIPTPTDDTGFDFVAPPPANLDDMDVSSNGDSRPKVKKKSKNKNKAKSIVVEGLPDQAWEGTIMEDGSAGSDATSCSQSQVYYDAAEAGSIFSMKNGFVSLDTVVNVADMRRRPGARCPVQGITLAGSGDQLYAPYLQRPFPLTDDLVLERRVMLARERDGDKKKGTLQGRIDLAHRLQKPKLLSDMCAFKAANPNSTIDDFTKWYGNPGNPLDDYVDDPHPDDVSVQDAYFESAAKKLDKASEAMKVLIATRDFWSSTWEEATPIPASEQQPLFNFTSTVEMIIDYLEQMHPANLVNQVMAVNLSSAYFTLVASAEDTLKIGLVQASLQRLRRKIDEALQLLSHDATGALFQCSDGGSTMSTTSNQYTSEDSIYACEEACNALSVTETMIARATSLLHKFPGQHNLVQDLLRLKDGSTVALTDPKGRSSFLNAIHDQQKQHSTFTSWESLPKPVLREYVLRNLDAEHPCQLSVRFGDEGAYLDRVDNEGGVLLALLKSYSD